MSMSTWIVLVILGYVVGGVLFLFSRCLTAKGEAHGGHEAPVVAPTFGSAMCGLTGIALILLSFWTTIHLMQTPEQFGKRHAYFHGLDAPQPPVGTPSPAASAVGGTPPAPKFVASTEAPPKAIHKTKSKKLFV
ncbi:MAG: hypothetical protein HOO67_06825, partial [Candidatus Peribacteraceae bacterium]|nr:hypothetical protein [Candidatus Peribacteraceae bacterium]